MRPVADEPAENLRSSVGYKYALEAAEKSSDVRDAVGEPIEAGRVSGTKKEHKGYHSLEMTIHISGPKGGGTLHVEEYDNQDTGEHRVSVRFVEGRRGKEVALPTYHRQEKGKEKDR